MSSKSFAAYLIRLNSTRAPTNTSKLLQKPITKTFCRTAISQCPLYDSRSLIATELFEIFVAESSIVFIPRLFHLRGYITFPIII